MEIGQCAPHASSDHKLVQPDKSPKRCQHRGRRLGGRGDHSRFGSSQEGVENWKSKKLLAAADGSAVRVGSDVTGSDM